MIELHITSLLLGGFIGLILVMAIAFFAVWSVDRRSDDRFSDGWKAGKLYGMKCYEVEKEGEKE
jgi:hypothetical protein